MIIDFTFLYEITSFRNGKIKVNCMVKLKIKSNYWFCKSLDKMEEII